MLRIDLIMPIRPKSTVFLIFNGLSCREASGKVLLHRARHLVGIGALSHSVPKLSELLGIVQSVEMTSEFLLLKA